MQDATGVNDGRVLFICSSCMEHDKVMRAMQLFATEVMPHFT
jgi:hypothetical protein